MRKSEKKVLIILIIVAILIIGGLMILVNGKNKWKGQTNSGTNDDSSVQQGEYTKVEEGGTIVNISQKVNENKQIQGFVISNVQLKEVNGETILSARITNNTDSNQKNFFGKIILLDSSNNEIGRIPVRVSETKAGETIEIKASITESYANAYDFRLEK